MKTQSVFLGLLFTSAVSAQALRFEQNFLFVKLNPQASVPHNPLIKAHSQVFNRIYRLETTDPIALENKLMHDPDVEWTEKSFIASESTSNPGPEVMVVTKATDPSLKKLWSFRSTNKNGASIQEAYQLDLPAPEKSVIVAVLDTGVDYRHPDLRNMMWVNPKEIPGNGLDDDGNGYIDDVHGINTLKRDHQGRASGDPMASDFHGTHVAGIIAAQSDNGIGIAGAAIHAKIMSVRTVPDNGDEKDRDVIESLLYAAKHGAKIINCSFGKGRSLDRGRLLAETLQHLQDDYGVLVVAASGNDSRHGDWYSIDRHMDYPAGLDNDNLLVVAATNRFGGLADFSNVGKINVDLAAPGEGIFSTMPRGRYGNASGTSMAAPLVSGIAAEVWANYPHLTVLELKDVLMESVDRVPSFAQQMVSGGRINMAAAFRNAGAR